VLVSGKFVHAQSGEPVSDAQVMAMPKGAMGLAGQRHVEIRPDGTFSFRHPPGEITLHALTSSGGPAQLQLTLVEGEDQTDVTLELEPPLAFKGKVVGPDGKGLAGAQVRSKWGGQTSPTETAEDGTFELPLGNQQPSQYQWLVLDATHPDLPGYRGMLAKPFQSESDAEGEIEMKRAGTIRGRVVKEDGGPIASAKVRTTINAENRGWPDGNAETDESGRYDFSDALSGIEYNVTATAEGYGQDSSERLTLDEGETRELPDLVLIVADQVIEGTVVDEDGNPVAGANINCHSRATGSRQTTTDDKGRFRLENLVDENIQIWAFQYRPEGQLQGQARAMAGDTDIEIVLGEQARPVSTEERQGRVLAGKDAPELDVAEWINGEQITLASLQGKTVVLAFWDSADDSCADLISSLNDLPSKHPDVEIVSVHSSDAESDALKQFISDNSIAHRVALDKPADKYKGATFEKYRVRRPPAIFIIDTDGKLRYQDIPLQAVEEALKTMLGGQ
jgi:peroxiredoxin